MLVALALLLAAPFQAQPVPPKVGILPVIGGLGLSAADRDHLRTRSRAAMLGPGVRVAEADELAEAETCADEACLKRSFAAHGVPYWLTIAIGGQDRMFTVQTTLWSLDSEAAVADAKERCVVCGRVELAELVAAQAWTMRRFVSETDDEPAVLVVDAPPVLAPKRWQRPLAISALAAATMSIGGGVALVAIDRRAVWSRCGPADQQNLDVDGDCRYVHQTLGAGIVMTALGVGLASAAVTLLVVDASRRRRHGAPSPRLRVRVGPGHVGLAGTF
jgi:hypothetical protein